MRATTTERLPTESLPFSPQWCMFLQREEIQSIWLHAWDNGFPTVVIIQALSVLSFSCLIINSPLMCLWHRKPRVSAWEKIEREKGRKKRIAGFRVSMQLCVLLFLLWLCFLCVNTKTFISSACDRIQSAIITLCISDLTISSLIFACSGCLGGERRVLFLSSLFFPFLLASCSWPC